MRRLDGVFLVAAAIVAASAVLPSPATFAAMATVRYEELKNWPALPSTFQMGEAAGVAVDASGHVFVFHRPGRGFDPAATNRSRVRRYSRSTATRGA